MTDGRNGQETATVLEYPPGTRTHALRRHPRHPDPRRRHRAGDRRRHARVLDALGAPFAWDEQIAGMGGVADGGDPLPPATLDSIRRTRLALKGPLTTPVGGGFRSVNVRLREEFRLYANLRPARTVVPGGRFDKIDLVLVRENLEGFYVGFEHYIPIGDDPRAVAIASGVNTGRRRAHRAMLSNTRVEQRPQEGHHRPQGQRAEGADRPLPRGRQKIAEEI